VTSPPIGTEAQGVWGEVEAAFLNGNQARLQLLADELDIGFAQGKTLMWSRDFLDQHGGLRALGRNLAEDVAATKLVRAAGRRVRLSHMPFAQPIGRRSFRAVWGRQLRWSKVRRDGFPLLFLIEPFNGALLPIVAAAFLGGPLAAALVAVAFYGAEALLCLRMGWPLGMAAPRTQPACDASARCPRAVALAGQLQGPRDRVAGHVDGAGDHGRSGRVALQWPSCRQPWRITGSGSCSFSP
jgi:ceramide glucosyltransferase